MTAVGSFDASESDYPLAQCYIPEERELQELFLEISDNSYVSFNVYVVKLAVRLIFNNSQAEVPTGF